MPMIVQKIKRFTAAQVKQLKELEPSAETCIMATWDIVSPGWQDQESFSPMGKQPVDYEQMKELLDHWLTKLPEIDRSGFLLAWLNYGPVTEKP